MVKTRNQTFIDMVRSMICYSDLPKFLWGYALETMTYILNSIPTMSVFNTPVELWARHKPSLRYYRIWGWPAYVLKKKTGKLETKS